MAPELRPRHHAPPADHTYSCLPIMPVYHQAPIVVSGPRGIFIDRVKRVVNVKSESSPRKKRKRRYYGERKRRYRTRRTIIGKQATASQGKRVSSTTVNMSPEELKIAAASCDNRENESKCNILSVPQTIQTILDDDSAPHVWSAGPVVLGQKRHTCCQICGGFRIKRRKSDDDDEDDRRHSARLVKKNYKLPFNALPEVAKLQIFSFLTLKERAAAALVCSDWAQLMRSPRVWNDLDFTVFDAPIQKLKHSPQAKSFQFRWFTTSTEYNMYRQRVLAFVSFLKELNPVVEYLRFSFDIAHPKDEWLRVIMDLITHSKCRNLKKIDIDWTDTPVRPPCADVFCCLFNKVRVLFLHHIKRVCKFHKLFDQLTKIATSISYVKLPFDWSPRSILLMSRLQDLQVLKLKKYVLLNNFNQNMLDILMLNLPKLKHLFLEVCMPTYRNRQTYSISHPKLQILDISQCQGFFFKEMNLPELQILRFGKMPWKGPLVERQTNTLRCIYEILCSGARNTVQVNKHKLQAYWLEFMYEELDSALEKLCPCKDHTLNWN